MYTVCVRDHMMIAHSFSGAVFGPAQQLHGATYVIDVEFRRPELDENGIVVDIGLASTTLHEVLAGMNYRNLDAQSEFSGRNTTTEFLAKAIFERLEQAIREQRLGPSATAVTTMRVTLHESHVAWAAFEGALGGR